MSNKEFLSVQAINQQSQFHNIQSLSHISKSQQQKKNVAIFKTFQSQIKNKNSPKRTPRISIQIDQRKALESIQKLRRFSRLSRGLSLADDHAEAFVSLQLSSFFAWSLLVISLISNAIVPCWMTVDIACQGITRSAWRIFTLSVLLIPFMMYEQRNITNPEHHWKKLLTRGNFQKIFVCSINYCVWAVFGVMATKITARTHSFCFIRVKFFLQSIRKISRGKEYHESQMGGSILVFIGILVIMYDSYSLPQTDKSAYFLSLPWWQRILGDLLALVGSVVLLYLDTIYVMPKHPKFTNLYLYHLMTAISLITFGYFFGGNQFSFNPQLGVFGLFTQNNFVSVFYVSIMLGLNLILANVLVQKIFSQFVRNVAGCFQIVFTTLCYHLLNIQKQTGGAAGLGLAFIVPGMMLIVGGQNLLQKRQMHVSLSIYQQQSYQDHGLDQQMKSLQSTPSLKIQQNSPDSSLKSLDKIHSFKQKQN